MYTTEVQNPVLSTKDLLALVNNVTYKQTQLVRTRFHREFNNVQYGHNPEVVAQIVHPSQDVVNPTTITLRSNYICLN